MPEAFSFAITRNLPTSRMTTFACSRKARPMSVRLISRLDLVIRRTPNSLSSWFICRKTEAGEVPNSLAAAEKLPVRTTNANMSNACRGSTRSPYDPNYFLSLALHLYKFARNDQNQIALCLPATQVVSRRTALRDHL